MNKRILKEYIKLIAEDYYPEQKATNRIGYLYSHIAGDYSYTDRLYVEYNGDDTVTVRVVESSPYGGMDYKGHGSVERESFKETVPADPKKVMGVIKDAINSSHYTFKKYGKATKNFNWNSNDIPNGLSMKNLVDALEFAKELQKDY